MRLFIGIELPADIKAFADARSESLRQRLRAQHVTLDARWTPTDNLHITLQFLGEVADEQAQAISSTLRAPLQCPAFNVRFGGFGAFPTSGNPRVLWIGIDKGGDALAGIHAEVANRLSSLGLESEDRRYTAHLTVARIREFSSADRVVVRRTLAEPTAPIGSCRIDTVTLFRSRLSPHGAQHEAQLRIPLT